jgi:hypothetical protein
LLEVDFLLLPSFLFIVKIFAKIRN